MAANTARSRLNQITTGVNTMEHLNSPRIWLAAAVVSIILGSAWQLDEPSEISVMQAVAADAQVRVVLP